MSREYMIIEYRNWLVKAKCNFKLNVIAKRQLAYYKEKFFERFAENIENYA